MSNPSVLIFREEFGIASEPFVTRQAAALQRYTPHLVGIKSSNDFPGLRPVTGLFGERPSRMAIAARRLSRSIPREALERLSKLSPQVIHSHFGIDSILGMELAKRLAVPLVATFHGYDVFTADSSLRRQGYGARLYVRRRAELIEQCTRAVAVSEHVASALSALGFPESKIVQHYIGVDTSFFCPPSHNTARKPIVLFVGRLVPSKGLEFLIRAMVAVQARCQHARLVVIGTGPEAQRLSRMASATLNSTLFLGACDGDRIRDWLQKAAIMSVPSIPMESGYVEALGLALIEAQATGTPVVSFNTGGIQEAVLDGETGFLSPPGDWKDLANRIVQLLSDAQLWGKLSSAAARRANSLFDIRQQTVQLEEIYDDARRSLAGGSGK